MSNPFHNFDWSLKSIAKIFGVFILGSIGVAITVGIIVFALRTVVSPFTTNHYEGYGRGGGYHDMAMNEAAFATKSLSGYSNIMPPIPGDDGEIIDTDAEDYEVRNYYASYKTADKTETCATIAGLKSREEIVFESANESEYYCNYRFEVENKYVDEVLQILEGLDPEDLNENVHTIQRSVQGTSDRLKILQQKLEQTEKTLAEAQTSYEELMNLATKSRDVENLTQLITLKIEAIEQLAQTKISINEEMERVQRNREDQLRRIAYTEFNVNVYEERFVDWRQIINDWKQEIRNFVDNLNDLTQFASVRLVSFLLYAAAALLYIAIAFGFLKLLWIIGKRVWKLGQ